MHVIDLEFDRVIKFRADERVAVVAVDQDENLAIRAGPAQRCLRRGDIFVEHRRSEFTICAESPNNNLRDFLGHGSLRGRLHSVGNTNPAPRNPDQFRPDVAHPQRLALIHTSHGDI